MRKGEKKTQKTRRVHRKHVSDDVPALAPTDHQVDRAEELLCMGMSPSRVRRLLIDGQAAKKDTPAFPKVPAPVAARAIFAVYERWDRQSIADAPYRRERVIRMVENFYTKSVTAEQFTAATAALQMLARMSGAFVQHDPNRDKMIAALGPLPDDPTLGLVYAQKCMLLALQEVALNASIDPEKRIRWIADIGAKIGITHAKTLVQHKLDQVASRVIGPVETTADEMEDGATFDYPAASRFGPPDSGDRAVPGPGAGDAEPKDG